MQINCKLVVYCSYLFKDAFICELWIDKKKDTIMKMKDMADYFLFIVYHCVLSYPTINVWSRDNKISGRMSDHLQTK